MTSLISTVYVVDDDVSFLNSMSRFLRAAGFDVKTFPSAGAFLSALTPESRGCVIADLRMPRLSGLDLQDALSHSANPMPIIFLSGHGDIPTTVQAMRHGAEDFLTKRAPKETLLAAVQRALRRDVQVQEETARLRKLRSRFADLTSREREILGYVLQGKLNKQTAFDLGVTDRTVKWHRARIMQKVGVQSVAELTRLVEEAGFFKDGQLKL